MITDLFLCLEVRPFTGSQCKGLIGATISYYVTVASGSEGGEGFCQGSGEGIGFRP